MVHLVEKLKVKKNIQWGLSSAVLTTKLLYLEAVSMTTVFWISAEILLQTDKIRPKSVFSLFSSFFFFSGTVINTPTLPHIGVCVCVFLAY